MEPQELSGASPDVAPGNKAGAADGLAAEREMLMRGVVESAAVLAGAINGDQVRTISGYTMRITPEGNEILGRDGQVVRDARGNPRRDLGAVLREWMSIPENANLVRGDAREGILTQQEHREAIEKHVEIAPRTNAELLAIPAAMRQEVVDALTVDQRAILAGRTKQNEQNAAEGRL